MIIEAQGLTKIYKRYEKEEGLAGSIKSLFQRKYSEKRAVSALDLQVREGEFVGLIGANGAGKTTLIKMLTGIIAPSGGNLSVMGYRPNRLEHEFKRQYAVVMGQKSQLFFELTATDTFALFREMYGIPEAEYRRNVAYFVELFGVEKLVNVQVRTLSLGERMKMELIVALLHNPRVLFLDEPTLGLDAVAQRQMRGFLRSVNQERGTTILLTSHYMEDILSLCPRCAVISQGEKIYDGDTGAMMERFQRHKKITVRFEEPQNPVLPEDAQIVEQSPDKLCVLIQRQQTQAFLAALVSQSPIADIRVEEEDIGVVVERIYAAGKGGPS